MIGSVTRLLVLSITASLCILFAGRLISNGEPMPNAFPDPRAPKGFSLGPPKVDFEGLLNLARQGENYIIKLKDGTWLDEFENHLQWLNDHLNTHLPLGRIIHQYNFGNGSFCGYSGTFHPTIIEVLRALPVIDVIEKDQLASIAQSQPGPSLNTVEQTNAPWGISRIWQRQFSFPSQYLYFGADGYGVDAYIVDTGVYVGHSSFSGRAVEGISFSDNPTGDQNGHGTHVAGIVGSYLYGVAKYVKLISVKVLNSNGSAPWSSIIAGINWVIEQSKTSGRASVINVSIAGPTSDVFNSAVNAAVSAGVHVVAAAGNNNVDACTMSPGSASGITVVGAIGQSGTMSSFSNYGSCVTLLAPGEVIQSAGISSPSAVQYMSGTSMASPHVTGIVSAILSQVQMSPKRLKLYLTNTATTGQVTVSKPIETTGKLAYLSYSRITASEVIASTS